jgi:hypothetical protein
MEHRWGERVPMDVPVRVSAHAFSQREGRLSNLSVSGALLIADLETRILARVEIHVVTPHRRVHEAPGIQAFIARRYRHGFGLEWCEFAPDAIADLLRAAQRHPFAHHRHPTPASSLTRSRLLGAPLLRHAE